MKRFLSIIWALVFVLSLVLFAVSCRKSEETATDATTVESTNVSTTSTTEITQKETTESTNEETTQRIVYYSDFGAVGDGTSDDFLPICAAHAYANYHGFSVKATEGATYYIGKDSLGKQVEIQTDTDWTGAKIIIDDRYVEVDSKKEYTFPIFRIAPSIEGIEENNRVSPLQAGAKNIGYAPGEKCLAVVENRFASVFKRTGIHAGSGETQKEIVLLDENGDIDESTPLNWTYETITSCKIYHIDETEITIRGGEFLTLTNVQMPKFTYFHRNIIVERSNVTLEGITHLTEGENDEGGAPYHGFIYVHHCANVTVKNCVFTPHYIFADTSQSESSTYGYDIHVNTAVNVKFTGCTQTISIDDTNYWGVFTSNFARNLTLEDCILSRFDAHRGVYNVDIKRCTFGHQSIRFVGFGLFTIEDTTVRASNLIILRNDYGSTFEGKIVIKNCVLEPQSQLWSKSELIYARNDSNHDYGYMCCFPEIVIDGLIIKDTNATTGYHGIYILPVYTESDEWKTATEMVKYYTPEKISLKGIVTESGIPYKICRVPELYPNLKIEE